MSDLTRKNEGICGNASEVEKLRDRVLQVSCEEQMTKVSHPEAKMMEEERTRQQMDLWDWHTAGVWSTGVKDDYVNDGGIFSTEAYRISKWVLVDSRQQWEYSPIGRDSVFHVDEASTAAWRKIGNQLVLSVSVDAGQALRERSLARTMRRCGHEPMFSAIEGEAIVGSSDAGM